MSQHWRRRRPRPPRGGVAARLRAVNPLARQVRATFSAVAPDDLFAARGVDELMDRVAAQQGHQHHDHDHGHDDHDHSEEMPLPPLVIGDLSIECNQAHGPLEAGVEGHLVVKLPYSDDGASVIRAWIGGEDRTMSMVGLGVYAASHDDYDIHTMAPDPLPADARWWIEIERPDGTTLLGSVAPIVD